MAAFAGNASGVAGFFGIYPCKQGHTGEGRYP